MSKSIDQLAKNLASGMSRRKALWSFLSGVGAVGALAALAGRKATAQTSIDLVCVSLCTSEAQQFKVACLQGEAANPTKVQLCNNFEAEFLSACLAANALCASKPGSCAEYVQFNQTSGGTITVQEFFSFIEDPFNRFVCVPRKVCASSSPVTPQVCVQ